jgi:hypothetical protein
MTSTRTLTVFVLCYYARSASAFSCVATYLSKYGYSSFISSSHSQKEQKCNNDDSMFWMKTVFEQRCNQQRFSRSRRWRFVLKQNRLQSNFRQGVKVVLMSTKDEDPNDQLSTTNRIQGQGLDIGNEIDYVRQQLEAIQDDIRNVNYEIEMVEYCISKKYDEWLEAAKEKYGFEGEKDLPTLQTKQKYLHDDKKDLKDKEKILLENLLQITVAAGKKQAKEQLDSEEKMKRRGKDFVESIIRQQSLQVIEEQQLYCMKDVSMLDGEKTNIIISQNICDFWSKCIELATGDVRICASGSPGIGKSTTMMYLIWVLLNMGKRVVYLLKTPEKDGFYHEWKINSDGSITSNIYPESMNIRSVIDQESDDFKNTYYLCDPGYTKDNIMPPPSFLVNLIANASADDRHWGANEFMKGRGDMQAIGIILTFPMMTKDEIFQARTLFKYCPDEQTLEKRHRDFGNIPRFLFEKRKRARIQRILTQDAALDALSADSARRIMNNLVKLNNNDKDSPSSAIMCVTSEYPDFMRPIASFVSDRVAEKAAATHISNL